MAMDLAHLQLRFLLKNDSPFGEVASALKDWRGEMPQELVQELGEYIRPDRSRIHAVGRPKKEQPSTMRDGGVMNLYFALCDEGVETPERVLCTYYRWAWREDKKTGSVRCTEFEQTRSRFNKWRQREASVLFRHLQRHSNASRAEIIDHVRLAEHDMPTDYFNRYILPKL